MLNVLCVVFQGEKTVYRKANSGGLISLPSIHAIFSERDMEEKYSETDIQDRVCSVWCHFLINILIYTDHTSMPTACNNQP